MNKNTASETSFFPDWPYTNASQFISAADITWHVQTLGLTTNKKQKTLENNKHKAPVIFFIHGTGSSTHSWANLIPHLEEHFEIICIDLPGHGFTEMPPSKKLSLPNVADMVQRLLEKMNVNPDMVIGHSAGAAVLTQLCLSKSTQYQFTKRQFSQPKALISINGALLPLSGVAAHIFSPAAKLLANISFIPNFFTKRAKDPNVAKRMVKQTGSVLSPQDIEKYHHLLSSPKHVNAALQMMANWNLENLGKEFPKLEPELHLIACENDQTISINESRRVHKWMVNSFLHEIPALGHLGHEEEPTTFARLILEIAEKHKLIDQ